MATTTTSKIAEAISLLSDVLSKEVDTGSQFADEDDSVSADDHDDLKSLAEDFATDAQISLEEVQVELQAIVDPDDEEDSDMYSWNPPEGSEDDDDWDDDDEDDDPGNGEVDLTGDDDVDPADDDDETEPTDEVKIDMLTLAGAELEEKIEDQEQTIEDLKNTMSSVLDNVNTLLEATQTFNDALDEA